jgi:uncharacterized membrane protein
MAGIARISLVLSLFGACSLACGEKQNPLGSSEAEADCETMPVSYADTIAPMMAASCTVPGACHSAATGAAGVTLETYDDVKLHAANSNKEIQAQAMPIGNGVALTENDRKAFALWATCGTPNN